MSTIKLRYACELLIAAYKSAATDDGGSVDWSDLDRAHEAARTAIRADNRRLTTASGRQSARDRDTVLRLKGTAQ